MKTGIIILSRFNSRRFPGKALTPIAGRELLGRVVDRMRKVRNADALIIATSNQAVDDPIVQFAQKDNIECFRGDAIDVAGRCHACCQDFKLDHFVRICGDSPLIDPVLVMKLIDLHGEFPADVTSNVFPRTWPAGNSIEVVSFNAMTRLLSMTDDPDDREHVTQFFHQHAETFVIQNNPAPEATRDVELTVDYPEDVKKIEWILERLSDDAPFEEIVRLARERT